jgi:hypothetical protein
MHNRRSPNRDGSRTPDSVVSEESYYGNKSSLFENMEN